MKRILGFLSIMICTLVLSGCAKTAPPVERTSFLLDTVISIRLYDGDEEDLDSCFSLIQHYDRLFSATDPESDISRINAAGGEFTEVDPDTAELVEKAKEYGRLSDGSFDATIGALSSLWDFHSENPKVPEEADIKAALKTVDYNNITVSGNSVSVGSNGAKLDLGGIAKGYITDRLRELLISRGVTSASVSLGGNVYVMGKKPDGSDFTVGIQKPFSDDGTPAATITASDISVVTSGVYQRYFESEGRLYHHILDPATGYPIENDLYSVTIISKASVDGDALSTFVFSLGLDAGIGYVEGREDIEAVFIDNKNGIHPTSGMDAYGFKEF